MARQPRRLTRFAREMRMDPTPAEAALWQALRGRSTGVRFRRQQPLGPFIVDFVSHGARLVVEIDGPRHDSQTRQSLDEQRDRKLAELGYRVIRLDEYAVQTDPFGAADDVWSIIQGHRVPPLSDTRLGD